MVSCTLKSTLLLVLATAHFATSAPNVVCYYGSWATYRGWPGTFNVADIDTTKCTHVVYAFAGLNAATVGVVSLDPWNDLEDNGGKGSYKKFAALSQANPDVKTLLAVGGWNEGSGKYSTMAATSAGRKRFATSVVTFLETYGFQGLDLDWEYPTQREGARPADKANFVLLLKELSTQLKAKGMLLTVAVSASANIIDTAYDIAGISELVDLVNLMTFDYFTAASGTTAHAAPLGSSSNPASYSVRWSVQKWLDGGCPSEKLVVGIPLYARTYTLASEDNHGLGAPAVAGGLAGPISQEAGSLAYFELCMLQEDEGWTIVNDAGGVYSYYLDQWASYENVDTIAEKTKYVLDNKLGGVMVWALESDDNNPVCAGVKNTLLTAVHEGLGRV